MNKITEEDLVAKGFHRLDSKLITDKPPKIKWGDIYNNWADVQKVKYLEKLAASMNHAASLIQNERDQLNELMELKEAQIVSMKEALDANNKMIQSEITRTNEEKQNYHKLISELNAQIRELKSGNNS